ncbi:MAG: FAD-dependent monooxygenase [Candidatus Marinimicrobia bacterium]|nr:FAD-dependent monooxygenase [Candidatus Neomarinimicrobiota bacterium]
MIYHINQIKVGLDYTDQVVAKKVLQLAKIQAKDLKYFKIIRRSLDARHQPVYILTVEIKTNVKIAKSPDIQQYKPPAKVGVSVKILNYRGPEPIVVGAGPAGLMAALVLAENGVSPVIIERGEPALERARQITSYLKTGSLNTESNILFGEGGAGLFSDGKLTARSKDRITTQYFFQKLVEFGAPDTILIDAEPHLGSDLLLKIIPRIRDKIIQLGGTFHFNTKMKSLEISQGALSKVHSDSDVFETTNCILAIGHSARDVYRYLSSTGIALAPKPFAIGVRVELPQSKVNEAQYGSFANNNKLGAASFRLTHKEEGDYRACYSFCMCPGGEVMPCASSPGMMTTNGMSWSARDGKKANAAFLVPVNERDYSNYKDEKYPALEGLFFQEAIEQKIFKAGGSSYLVPAARLSDYLNNKASDSLPDDSSCRRMQITNINGILPNFVETTLKYAIPKMISKLNYPDFREVVVYCGETRSSSPVRIVRTQDSYESISIKGLYPCGEGAGHAGGIVSSALDGIKTAEALLKNISGIKKEPVD